MSIQDGSGILFEVFNDQQSLRLLELPPALLESLTSSRPSRYFHVFTTILTFYLTYQRGSS